MNPFGFDPFQNDLLSQMHWQSFPNALQGQVQHHQHQPHPQHPHPPHPHLQLSLSPHSMHRTLMEPMMMSPFSMFGDFRNMHQDMNNMMRNAQTAMNGGMSAGSSYQSFTSISYGSGAQPQVYQSSTSTKIGPNGVRETRQAEKNSVSGVQKIQIGHHLGDRGHIIEKSKNIHTGEQEESQEYVNIDEEQASDFNEEWMEKATVNRRPRQQQPMRSITYNHKHQRFEDRA